MLRVMVCDDDEYIGEWFGLALQEYSITRQTEFELKTFKNVPEMFRSIQDGSMPDVIFLDVLFPEGNGISLAKEIRGKIADCKLVLITSSNDFALQGYEVHAYDYLLKPLQMDVVFCLLDAFTGRQDTVITINVKGVPVGLKSPDISFIESSKHTVVFHSKGKEFVVYGKLDEYEVLLKNQASFIRCHQSYLINLSYVSEIKSRYFIMKDGVMIPMRKSSAAGFKRTYYSFVMGSDK